MTKISLALIASGSVLLAMLGSSLASTAERPEPSRDDRVVKTVAEWQEALTAEEFRILREAGTERAFTGDFWDDHERGIYTCGGCGLELFDADTKFESGTGWPSYYAPIAADRVDEITDTQFGMVRTEVVCARCGGHLGHVFPDGPKPTGQRYCINGNALDKLPAATKKSKKKRD
ncbi:MAG: peptide-methionine (R)-S-oxide reductase MsrB [Proteobacteria bacterium]|nr:peptide-methionine (R)-S-oxide reductase MsrB [Pseudomonadota bacterium]